MAGRELMKWILDNEAEDAKIEVQYRDSGGDYEGTDATLYLMDETCQDKDGWTYRRIVL